MRGWLKFLFAAGGKKSYVVGVHNWLVRLNLVGPAIQASASSFYLPNTALTQRRDCFWAKNLCGDTPGLTLPARRCVVARGCETRLSPTHASPPGSLSLSLSRYIQGVRKVHRSPDVEPEDIPATGW